MTLWSNGRLNAEVAKGNVCDIPNIGNHSHPLTFSWYGFLERQSLNRAELVAVGENHVNASLTKLDVRNVVFNLNHNAFNFSLS